MQEEEESQNKQLLFRVSQDFVGRLALGDLLLGRG